MHTFKRIIKYGWLNFSRNFWVSSATIGIMILALGMVAALVIGKTMTETFVSSLEQKVDISVYFLPEAEENSILEVKDVLEKRSEVKQVTYISRNEALDTFRERHSENIVLMESLEELGENPLQATLNVKAMKASQFEAITSFLEKANFSIIDKINFRENEKVIDKLISITSGIERAGILFSIILGAFVVLVTFNTIRLAIYAAREEISIMRLVGAGNWYIRGPFIITGMLYGAIAAIVTLLLLFVGTWLFAPNVSIIFAEVDLIAYYQENLLYLVGMLLTIGIGLGVVSSFVATRRYLNV